ncbi:16S rRNA (uracil(1498)-N(3))-methyltransferase [Candidatus Peregrinibacteria bacterium]|nr:16S rRNA (uracil(1498)-N(3))-methyltransferase [Candidatus Peregrinibacteria bacterium]
MQRFYIPSPDIQKNIIDIREPRVVFQAGKVLRMRTGSKFSIFDGKGREVVVEVLEIDRRKIIGNVMEAVERNTEPKLDIHLYQAIPKKPALFEWVVQKATEIGVNHIYPLITDRTEKKRLSKFERLQMIAIEAAEQSRRTHIPALHHPVNFAEAIKKTKHAYLAYEYEDKKSLADYLPAIQTHKEAHIFIGPEGGFDQKEIDLAIKNKVDCFTFGPRILRTETAAIAALSIVLLSGD